MTEKLDPRFTKEFHRQLVREGNFKSARLLLILMFRGQIFVSDNNKEAWSSGAADFLLIFHKCSNRKTGFVACLEKEVQQ